MRVLWKKGKWDMFKILRLPDKNRFNAGTAVMCVFLGMTFNAGTSFLIDALPVPEKWLEANEESTSAIMSGGLLPALFAAAVIAPLVEELLFRGIFYHSLKESLPLKNSTAAVITTAVVSICFGIYHGNILQGIYTALFAVVLSVILEKTGTLWAPVLGHLGFNSAWLPLALTSFLPESTPSWLLAVVFFAVFAVLFTVFLVGGKRKQYAGRGNDTGAGQTCY